jgi:Tol biopolymer transport system component
MAPSRAASVVRAVSASNGATFSPAFASTGTALFFHSGKSSDARSSLEAADLSGDDLQVMTIVDDGAKNYHVRPSPDGKRVAFDSDRDGERGVYVAYRDGSGARRVSGAGFAAVPTWSPDGSALAYIRGEADRPRVWNLWVQDLNTGHSRRLTSYAYGQTWSASWFPDGHHICYTHEDRLIVRDLDSGATREYASPIAHSLVRTPAVSPDGTHVIFQVFRSGAWLLNLNDGSMKCVLTDPSAEEFAWSPDGRRVAFHSRRDGQWGIWLMNPA